MLINIQIYRFIYAVETKIAMSPVKKIETPEGVEKIETPEELKEFLLNKISNLLKTQDTKKQQAEINKLKIALQTNLSDSKIIHKDFILQFENSMVPLNNFKNAIKQTLIFLPNQDIHINFLKEDLLFDLQNLITSLDINNINHIDKFCDYVIKQVQSLCFALKVFTETIKKMKEIKREHFSNFLEFIKAAKINQTLDHFFKNLIKIICGPKISYDRVFEIEKFLVFMFSTPIFEILDGLSEQDKQLISDVQITSKIPVALAFVLREISVQNEKPDEYLLDRIFLIIKQKLCKVESLVLEAQLDPNCFIFIYDQEFQDIKIHFNNLKNSFKANINKINQALLNPNIQQIKFYDDLLLKIFHDFRKIKNFSNDYLKLQKDHVTNMCKKIISFMECSKENQEKMNQIKEWKNSLGNDQKTNFEKLKIIYEETQQNSQKLKIDLDTLLYQKKINKFLKSDPENKI